MPEPTVREDIAAGRLVRLEPEGRQGAYPLHVMYRSDHPPGKAGRWLIQHFQDQAADTAATGQDTL
jgi:DNA-binding transcriptional LysR family regulator